MRHSLIFSLLLFLLAYTTLTAQDGWFHQDGNTERTAYVETDMAPPFKLDRTIETNEFFHDFTYAYGMVYFTFQKDGTNHIAAFDPDQQTMIWSKKMHGSRGGTGCYPMVTEDIVYAGA